MHGDEELGRVYHAKFFAWYAQRENSKYSQESRGAMTESTQRSDTQYSMLESILMHPDFDECV